MLKEFRVVLCSLLWLFAALSIGGIKSSQASDLLSHIEGVQTGNHFTYTIVNDEPLNSHNYLNAFQIVISAPVTVTNTPLGWSFDTDGKTFVTWFNTDSTPPYPGDVAPGNSLGGFQIGSITTHSDIQGYAVFSWDHTADGNGPSATGGVIAPVAPFSAAPEPCSLVFLLLVSLPIWVFKETQKRMSFRC